MKLRGPAEDPPADAAANALAVGHPWLEAALVVLIAAVLLLPGLGAYPLWDPDEGRHAEVARQMAEHGRWLVPTIYGEPYYDKPAPFYWVLRAAAALVEPAELAARLPSALATLVVAPLLYAFALRRLGRRAALLGTVIYLTSPGVVALGRFCNLDALLTSLVTIASLAWLVWLDAPGRTPWVAYAAMGLGSLVKGPVAILLPMLIATGGAALRGSLLVSLRRARPLWGIALTGAIFLPWLLGAAIADPDYAWTFLVKHNLMRYTSGSFDHARGPLYFGPALLALLFPWSLLVPAALLAGRRGAARDPRPGAAPAADSPAGRVARTERDLALWAGVVVVFFSIGRAKLAPYVLPALPPLALWLGSRLARLAVWREPQGDPEAGAPADTHDAAAAARRGTGSVWPAGSTGTTDAWLRAALVLWAVPLVAAPVAGGIYLHLEHPALRGAALWGAALPVVAWLGLRAAWRRPGRAPAVFATANAATLLAGYLVGAPVASRVVSDAHLARAAARLAPDAALSSFRVQPASLSFYSSAPVLRADEPEPLLAAAARGPLLIVTRRRHEAGLRAAGLTLYPWIDAGRHVLYGTQPPPAGAGAADAGFE